jgi:ectoine hydroxylase-related dioxygenase (phytanoyl-CoA dioxygenase family)
MSKESFSLAPEEVAQFNQDGFIGPFTGTAPAARIDAIARRLGEMIDEKQIHPHYGRFSVRDWHLLDDEILRLMTDPAIVGRLKSVLGKDLILWRSKVFDKQPGEGTLGWHQEWGAFNGEEIGNDVPGLQPAPDFQDRYWNLTVWIALVDVDWAMGPIQFARGTNRRRFPVAMAPIAESEFWHNPFLNVDDPMTIVKRAKECSLILDIDTSHLFDGVDLERLTLQETRDHVMAAMSDKVGAITMDFDSLKEEIITLPMRKGQFVIFTERTMHGSPPNVSSHRRLAINARVTHSSTIVYPGRLTGNYIDGSNLNISKHRCILISGADHSGANVFA